MANNQIPLGEKIHNYRKRAGLSQMQLETAIGAANGSVSRIESGQVNPTKETLMQISGALKLPPTERYYLLDEKFEEITAKDIQAVINTVGDVLNSSTFLGYLIDDKYNVVAISPSFMAFVSNLGIDAQKLIGKSMVEIVFNPELGIRKIIDPVVFESTAINLLSFFNQELNYRLHEQWWKELFARVKYLPDFEAIWEKTKQQKINGYNPQSRAVTFIVGQAKVDAYYSLTAVYTDPRFTIAEYTIHQTTP